MGACCGEFVSLNEFGGFRLGNFDNITGLAILCQQFENQVRSDIR